MKRRCLLTLWVLVTSLISLTQVRAEQRETIYFDPHAATPAMDSVETLETIKRQLTETPDYSVLIEGHADAGEVSPTDTDRDGTLRELSRKRADFVSNWLKSATGRPDMKNRISAMGTYRPADPQRPDRNRRVVVTLSDPVPETPAAISDASLPRAHVPAPVFTFDSVLEGVTVTHDYVIQNTGTGPLEIVKVNPG
ncbi:hypothetical protein JCM14469_39860 [Desulfatiferula olefinivorans]